MIKIDWKTFAVSAVIVVLLIFMLEWVAEFFDFCINPGQSDQVEGQTYTCIRETKDLFNFDLVIIIIVLQKIILPIFSYFIALSFYFRAHQMKKLNYAVILVLGLVCGLLFSLLRWNVLATLPTMLNFIGLISIALVVIFEIGFNIFYAIIGGLIAYHLSKPRHS